MPIARLLFRIALPVVLAGGILAGCSSHAPEVSFKGMPDRIELSGVPFFAGRAHHSAPMALASLLAQQGVTITPGLLESSLKAADDQALARNLQSTARDYGMVVYPLDSQLPALLAQVAAGNPVLVRFSEGRVWSEPRYAVLVGYDRYKHNLILRAAMQRRMLMKFDEFDKAWAAEGRFAVLVQSPKQLPAQVDRERWKQAAGALSQSGQEQAAGQAMRALEAR